MDTVISRLLVPLAYGRFILIWSEQTSPPMVSVVDTHMCQIPLLDIYLQK